MSDDLSFYDQYRQTVPNMPLPPTMAAPTMPYPDGHAPSPPQMPSVAIMAGPNGPPQSASSLPSIRAGAARSAPEMAGPPGGPTSVPAPQKFSAPMMASPSIPTEGAQSNRLIPNVTMAPYNIPSVAMAGPITKPQTPIQQTTQNAEDQQARLLSSGSGLSQVNSPLLRRLGEFGNAIGHIVAPGLMAQIPGTEEHHQLLLNRGAGVIGQGQKIQAGDEANAHTEAETGEQNAQAANLQSEMNLRDHPRPDYKPTDTASGIMGYDPATNSFAAPTTPSGQPEQPYVKPGPMQHVIVTGPDGKTPMYATYQDGKFLDPQGHAIPNAQPYEKPGDVRAVTLDVPGKGRVAGKADAHGNLLLENGQPAPEGSTLHQQPQQPSYASVISGIRGEDALSQASKGWSQESGSYQTTLGELSQATTGSELSSGLASIGIAEGAVGVGGVHRLNQVELDKAGPAVGSLGRRLQASLDKAGSGKLPPQTIAEAQQLVSMYSHVRYRQYLAQQAQNANNFGVLPQHQLVMSEDGYSVIPLSQAIHDAQDTQGGAPPHGATMKVPGSDGKMHWSDGKRDMGVVE